MGVQLPLPAPIHAPCPTYFQMLTAFDNATCFGCLGLASAAGYEFRYSAHPLSFLYFAFVRGRLCFGWFSPFTPDFGMRGGLVQFKSGSVRRSECAWSSIDDNGPLQVFRAGHPRNTLWRFSVILETLPLAWPLRMTVNTFLLALKWCSIDAQTKPALSR